MHKEILENLSIPGFQLLSCKNQKKNLKSNTAPGGIAVFVKENLVHLSSVVNTENEDIVWVKLKKEVSGEKDDIFIGTCYLSPSQSCADKTVKLMEDISILQAKGHVLINGDFNARTGISDDTVPPDKFDAELGVENSETPHKRNSQDKVKNNRGEDLLNICKSSEVYIVNGRKSGDLFGNFTCFKWNGNSVVDYLLSSYAIFDQISTFVVGPFLPMLSDHCPLLFTLETNKKLDMIEPGPPLKEAPRQFAWTNQETEKFQNALSVGDNNDKLNAILNLDFTDPSVIVDHLTTTLKDIAEKAKIKKVPISNPNTKRDPPWFDGKCTELKKQITLLGKKVKRHPKNETYKKDLADLKSLKKTVKKNKLTHKETILQNMNCSKKHSKKFWKLLEKLDHKQNDNVFKQGIPSNRWIAHFKTVLKNPHIPDNGGLPKNTAEQGPLDFEISDEEIKLGSYILRSGKSPGMDCIPNEMIWCLLSTKPEIVKNLFNAILKHPMVINKWHTSMISPIHKNGPKMNPDNYRGISLLCCFSKFFCAILNRRLLKFTEDRNILSKAQLGFLPGNRTSDALFILHNLIDYYCHKQKKYLFSCFVDFSKAFDTIPRKALFEKLLGYNINGKFYDCLVMLYSGDQSCIKLGNKITETFTSNQGVKQGCTLSPLLFNIFLSDLQKKLETPVNDPAKISLNVPLSCLVWADDLLLLSQSENGLNNMLKVLKQHSEENGLTINMKKTKAMIFNKAGRHIRRIFFLGDLKVETTAEYKYLGFKLTPFGGINPGLFDLKDRAQKAYFKMKNRMGPAFQKHPLITIKVFQALIQPILLYASDFWGALKMPQNNPFETLYLKFCKDLLGVQKQTTNVGVLLELGLTPLRIQASKNAIKNWGRIANNIKCNELITASYNGAITNNLAWPKRIKDVLSEIGMLNKFIEKDSITYVEAFQRMKDIFHQNSLSEIRNVSSKLRTYSTVKKQIGYEKYLSEIQNTQYRISLTKLRLSNHQLLIETGRHQKIEKHARFCPFCPNNVEDELHFLLECKVYRTLRNELFEEALKENNNFLNFGRNEKFVALMTTSEIAPHTAKCINRMFYVREYLLGNHKNCL